MILEIELDSNALNYFKSNLYVDKPSPDFPKKLSLHLLELNLDNGRIISYWNKDADRKRADNLKTSLSFYGYPLLSLSQPYLIRKIVQYLKSVNDGVAVFEIFPELSEKNIAVLECSYVYHDNLPYYLITGEYDKELEKAVKYAVLHARYYPFVCCLTTFPSNEFEKIKPASEFSTETLRKMVKRTNMIITDAYDAESFIVWERKEIKDVQAILRLWDPIGITPGEDAPYQEYDDYAPGIVSMVVRGCSVNELSKHLEWLRTDYIGMEPNLEHSLEFAFKIISTLRSD